MNDTYRYRSLFRAVEYRLTDEGVSFTDKKFGRFKRGLVPYDNIPIHSTTVMTSGRWLLWAAGVCAVFSLAFATGENPEPSALLFYASLCVIALGAYLGTRSTVEVFQFGDSYLTLFRRRSDKVLLANFTAAMQDRKFEFLKQRVARRVAEVPNEETARYLIYLRESLLLDEAGYGKLRSSVGDMQSGRGSIGFAPFEPR